MAEVQLRNITKRWGSFVGVHEFDLTIPDREFLVLPGDATMITAKTGSTLVSVKAPKDHRINIGASITAQIPANIATSSTQIPE